MIHKYENEEEKGKAVQDHVHVYCEAGGDVETCMKAIPKAYIMSMRRGVALLDLYIACAWRVTDEEPEEIEPATPYTTNFSLQAIFTKLGMCDVT